MEAGNDANESNGQTEGRVPTPAHGPSNNQAFKSRVDSARLMWKALERTNSHPVASAKVTGLARLCTVSCKAT